MKVWDTRLAITQGVFVREAVMNDDGRASYCDGGPFNATYSLHKGEYATTREEAIEQVAKKKAAKIASLKRQLAKLEALVVEIPE